MKYTDRQSKTTAAAAANVRVRYNRRLRKFSFFSSCG